MRATLRFLLALPAAVPATAQQWLDAPAPPLDAPAWALGEPVAKFEPGKVYVVQFLQDSASKIAERKPFGNWVDDRLPKVEPVLVFCDSWRLNLDKLKAEVAPFANSNLRVAFDPGRKLHQAWIAPTGARAPITIVVDQRGNLIWCGDRWWLRFMVDAALAGEDGAKARAALEALQARAQALRGKVVDAEGAAEVEAICERYPPAGALLLHAAVRSLDRAGEFALADRLLPAAIDALVTDRDEVALDALAWRYVDPARERPDRQLDLALKAAEAANAIDAEPHHEHLRTLARAWFWKGRLDKAIEVQKRAIEAIYDDDDRPSFVATLAEYEAARGGR